MTAVAIFVKTPGHSPLKTRLAASTGAAWAEHWHRLAASAVAAAAVEAAIGPVLWAVAEAEASEHPLWSKLPVIQQPRGGLGTRMQSIHDRLVRDHGSALLLGADAPQLDPTCLFQAAAWLQESSAPRLCLGPAADGGFWTFGSNCPIPLPCWTGVDYSRPDTALDFQAALTGLGEWLVLPPLTDLDEFADLPAVLAELRRLPGALPAQRALLAWLEANPALGAPTQARHHC